MESASFSWETATWESMSVQQESRFGVLKNRPVPSTVAVTLLGNSTALSPRCISGIAIIIDSCLSATGPANRSRVPLPLGRCMLSHIISEPDQLTAVSMLPNRAVCRAPFTPQPVSTGAAGVAAGATADRSQATSEPNTSRQIRDNFCAARGFF